MEEEKYEEKNKNSRIYTHSKLLVHGSHGQYSITSTFTEIDDNCQRLLVVRDPTYLTMLFHFFAQL
jgi:hypothetical protein